MKFLSYRKREDDFILEQPIQQSSEKSTAPQPSHQLTADEVLNFGGNVQKPFEGNSALESLKKRMQENNNPASSPVTESFSSIKEPEKPLPPQDNEPVAPVEKEKTLLEKCRHFITDEDGKDASIPKIPLYKLESVAEILKNDSQNTIDRLAKQYNITVDDLGKNPPSAEEPNEEVTPAEPSSDTEVIEINAFFKNVQSSVPFAVSEVEADIDASSQNNPSDGATITFTPINNETAEKPKIVVSGNTQSIDLTGEIAPIEDISSTQAEQITLEKNEFEEFAPEDEIRSKADIKKFIRRFSINKRRRFFVVVLSALITAILGFMKLPFMSGFILGSTQSAMIICTVLSGITILLNMDMFLSLPKTFSKKSVADVCPSLASLFVLLYAVFGIIKGEIVLDILLLLGVILSVRALGKFRKESYMLSNLRQITTTSPKNAVKLIDDNTVTFAMAKNSIEGDTLIAAPQKCDNISDYIKYSTFGVFLNGKMPIITLISLIISIISGVAAALYFDGVYYGFYAAAAVQCFTSLPSLFFIKDFPLYSAAKKLNKNGGMIAGQAGASHIEMANALMINSADIFPFGTVTLHQMKILSENDLDKTILRAASLTECLNSPLAPIFKKIAGESNISSLPDSDTIKYEEKMGISGWVDDQLLFIGNRTLMQAHGIDVPDIEIDRKILRTGYFPVYVASADKVCALLVVQYSVDPEVVHELRRLTKIGVTLLVNNTDPNITDQMICDYLGLYEDSVMIMTNAGYHMYKNSATHKENCSAPAAYRFGNLTLAKIINCAHKIRVSNTLLTVLYIIFAILGIMIFAYSSFAGSGTLIGSSTVLIYSLICTAVSYILYLIEKP